MTRLHKIECQGRVGYISVVLDENRTAVSGKIVYSGDIYDASKQNHVGVWFCNDALRKPMLSAMWKKDTESTWRRNGVFAITLSNRVSCIIDGYDLDDCPF